MKNTLIAATILLAFLLSACNSKYEFDAPQQVIESQQTELKLDCTSIEDTMKNITQLFAGYIAANTIPPDIAGVIISKTPFIDALNQAAGSDKIGIYFLEEPNGEKFLWLIAKKQSSFISTRLPKSGKPLKKCCPQIQCCSVIRAVPSLCLDNDCQPALEGPTDSITQVLGNYMNTLTTPAYIPGISISKSSMIATLTSTPLKEKVGIFLIQLNGIGNILLAVGTKPMTNNNISVMFARLPSPTPFPGQVCCDQGLDCCDTSRVNVNVTCQVDGL